MLQVKRLVLDVLKPHTPGVLEFAGAIARKGEDYKVEVNVLEMDDKTETLEVVVEGSNVQLETIVEAIHELGGSLHSVDGVFITNSKD